MLSTNEEGKFRMLRHITMVASLIPCSMALHERKNDDLEAWYIVRLVYTRICNTFACLFSYSNYVEKSCLQLEEKLDSSMNFQRMFGFKIRSFLKMFYSDKSSIYNRQYSLETKLSKTFIMDNLYHIFHYVNLLQKKSPTYLVSILKIRGQSLS